MRTYSVTVTRPASSDATLERLKLSGIDIGDGPNRGTYVGNQTSFKANVYHSVSQTTVTPTVNQLRGELCHKARRRGRC